jgi:hypothetical protein
VKYFIRVGVGTDKELKQGVEAEPLVIPGFEQIQLFIFNSRLGEWNISEAKTGYAIVHILQDVPTKKRAVEIATQKMQDKGLQWMLDNIKKYKPVAELPEANQ